MRILLISTVFPPQNAPASPRIAGFAEVWAGAGHDVTVLTTPKRHEHRGFARSDEGYVVAEVPFHAPALLNSLRAKDRVESGSARNHGSPEPDPPRWWVRKLRALRERTGVFGAARMPDLTDFWVRPAVAWAHEQCRDQPDGSWDVAVSSSGPYTTHLAARRLKRDGLVRSWAADFRDLWIGNEPFTGLFPFTLIERRLERSCLREADVVTTISQPLADQLAARSGRAVEVISNGFDNKAWVGLSAEPALPRDGRRRLVYTGTLYPAGHEPLPLLMAMAALRANHPRAADRFRLVIAGPKRELWIELADQAGVADLLEFRGEVDRETALRLQRDADGLLMLDWRKPEAGVLTSKLFEYLPASAPILAVGGEATSAIGKVIAQTRRGVHLGRNVDAIMSTVLTLIDDPSALSTAPDAQAVALYDFRRQAMRYLELLSAHEKREGF